MCCKKDPKKMKECGFVHKGGYRKRQCKGQPWKQVGGYWVRSAEAAGWKKTPYGYRRD